MGKRAPRVIDYVAFSVRLLTKIVALVILYTSVIRTGSNFLVLLALLLSEVYQIVAVLIVVFYPMKRRVVFSLVGAVEALLLAGGLYFLDMISTDAYLLVLLLLASVAISGGLLPALLMSVLSSVIYFLLLLDRTSMEIVEIALRVSVFPYTLLVFGALGEFYHRNIEEMQQLQREQERIKQAGNIREKFTMIASHNLRTPLTSIKGYLELLQDDAVTKEGLKPFIQKIAGQVERLEYLMEQLLRLSSLSPVIPADQLEEKDIVELLGKLVNEYRERAEAKSVTLEFVNRLEREVVLKIDPHAIKEAIGNLLDNAIKSTGEGDTISVITDETIDSFEVIIQDTGIGIPKEELPNLFTRFYHVGSRYRQEEGLGLGLYMTKSIIDAHEGEISVESTEGEGSTFVIKLPKTTTAQFIEEL